MQVAGPGPHALRNTQATEFIDINCRLQSSEFRRKNYKNAYYNDDDIHKINYATNAPMHS